MIWRCGRIKRKMWETLFWTRDIFACMDGVGSSFFFFNLVIRAYNMFCGDVCIRHATVDDLLYIDVQYQISPMSHSSSGSMACSSRIWSFLTVVRDPSWN